MSGDSSCWRVKLRNRRVILKGWPDGTVTLGWVSLGEDGKVKRTILRLSQEAGEATAKLLIEWVGRRKRSTRAVDC